VKVLQKPEEFFDDFAQLELNEREYEILRNGQSVQKNIGELNGPILAMFGGRCVGVVRSELGILKFEKQLVQQ
jgi:hypothetical protein